MSCLLALLLFPFVTVPSIIYGISAYILLPVGLLLSVFTGKPSFFKASRIAVKLLPPFLILAVPAGLYFVWWPLGLIFAIWMIIYFISRRHSGVSERESQIVRGWEEAEVIEKKMKDAQKRSDNMRDT